MLMLRRPGICAEMDCVHTAATKATSRRLMRNSPGKGSGFGLRQIVPLNRCGTDAEDRTADYGGAERRVQDAKSLALGGRDRTNV